MRLSLLLVASSIAVASPAAAAAGPVAAPPPAYADLADVALAAPVAAVVTVADARKLKPADAPGVAAGATRLLVTATVDTLIRGAGGLPGRVSYLVDVAPDARGKPPRLKKARFILLAAPVPGRPGELRLIAPDAQMAWNMPLEARLRAILAASAAADAAPVVTGVGAAFYVPGALPGESETQIFLPTADGRPVSLSVLRRPGEQPRWAVALGEIVDEAAAPPARDTLLWYRLACALPPALPDSSTARLDQAAAAAARDDYRLVIAGLGPCTRTRRRA